MTPKRRVYAEKRVNKLKVKLIVLREHYERNREVRPRTFITVKLDEVWSKQIRSTKVALKRWQKELAAYEH